MAIKEYSDNFAYDISFSLNSKGEIYDEDVINQSIQMILSTSYGERLFNLSFGSGLPNRIFDNITETNGERLLDDIAGAIKKWEDRITIIESQMRLNIDPDRNSVTLDIPYVINRDGKVSRFKKKIIL